MVTKPRAASPEFRGPTRRTAERQQIAVPGRITWRDSRGMARFASVIARDVSASGAYLDSRGADAIPLYRLVYLQLERGVRDGADLSVPVARWTRAVGNLSGRSLRPRNGHAVGVRPALSG